MKDPFQIIAACLLGKAPLVQLVPSHHSAQTGTAQAAVPSLTARYGTPRQALPNELPQRPVTPQPDALPRRAGQQARPSVVQEAVTQVRAGDAPSGDGPEDGSKAGPGFGPGFGAEVPSGPAKAARTVPEERHVARASVAVAGPDAGGVPRGEGAVGPVAAPHGPLGTKAHKGEQGAAVLPAAGFERVNPAPNNPSAVEGAGPVQRDGSVMGREPNPATPKEGRFNAEGSGTDKDTDKGAGSDAAAGARGPNGGGAEPDTHRTSNADETRAHTRSAVPAAENVHREQQLEQQRHDAGQTSKPSAQSGPARPDTPPRPAQSRPEQHVSGAHQQRKTGDDMALPLRVAKPAVVAADGPAAQWRNVASPSQDDGRNGHVLSGRSQQGAERAALKPEHGVGAEREAHGAGPDPLTATDRQGTLAKSRGVAPIKADPQGTNARPVSAAGDQPEVPHRRQATVNRTRGAKRPDTATQPDIAAAHEAISAAARDTSRTGARPAASLLDAAQQPDAKLRSDDSPSPQMRPRIERPKSDETRQPFDGKPPSKDAAGGELRGRFVASHDRAAKGPDGRDPIGDPQRGTQNNQRHARQGDEPAWAAPTRGGGADGMLHLHIERLEIVRSSAPVDPNPNAPTSSAKRAAPIGLDRFLSGKRR